jgi:hypothetical protein
MTNENAKTSYQHMFVHIFRKKHFKENLENFMSESLNADLLLIVSYHFVRKAKSQPIRDKYSTNAISGGPEWIVIP